MVLALLVACAPKPVDRSTLPGPLPARPFVTPEVSRGKLASGLPVAVIENHETPLVWARVAIGAGGFTDPIGKEGLASVTLDMMNEGAGPYDAAGLSAALKKLGSDLGTSAGDDGASVWVSGLKENFAPTLDLLSLVLQSPTFPDADWALLEKQRLAGLARVRKDPDAIATRVFDHVLFGDVYKGRLPTEASYGAITTADMREWWSARVHAGDAMVLVGGDVTLAEALPALEKALGAWKTGEPSKPPTEAPPAQAGALHVVDRPGAAQSVLRVGGYVTEPTDPDWYALTLANQVVGGQFMSRLNMDLREDKGWTYGARSSVGYDHAGGRFVATTSVRSDVTKPALEEVLTLLKGVAGDQPLQPAEVEDARSSLVYAWPLRFENPDWQLGQEEAVWRYHLPSDWTARWLPGVSAATLADAQKAWGSRIAPGSLTMVVVGDLATLRAPLAELGLPIIEHDADGNVVAARKE